MLNLVSFVTVKELKRFFKIAAQASEARGFLNIFLRFKDFCGSFSYKHFLIKKTCKAFFVFH